MKMRETFVTMDAEKRDRIINSALEEFSENSFEKASTNNIVKNADISKGLLYHYFSSKQVLYDYIESFAIETVVQSISDNIDWHQSDFFERARQIVKIKMEVTYRYPHIYDFLLSSYQKATIEKLKKHAEEASQGLYEKIYSHNIDYTKFKDDIDIKRTLAIIGWTFEKYAETIIQDYNRNGKSLADDDVWLESDQYIDVLKKAFYKEEYV